ncbi:MAG: N-6 DNA methylase, partial [Candidatus Omnitrophica bacterium]|nr:N-6 DNA methylase [Candidatus Omnitrophota bacterium]
MPKITTHIFNRKKLHSILKNISIDDLSGELKSKEINKIINNWQSLAKRGVLDKKGEVQLQDSFLKGFFGRILQYKGMAESPDEWFYEREKTTTSDATRSDAAFGFFTGESKDDVRVAVELKSAKTNLDQKQARKGSNYTPVEQAFMYANKFGKACRWIIVSNYIETRLYRSSSMNEYEVFFIENLDKEEELKKFLYLLYRKKLITKDAESAIDKLYRKDEAEQEQISKVFYKQYKEVRYHLFGHLKKNYPDIDELTLLEKTQKILDRFIFVCFCEDTGLLPERIFRKVLDAVKSNGLMVEISAWDQIRGLFRSVNEGNPARSINRYDGGLFAFDDLLDGQLVLENGIINGLVEITDYDFESDLNVNILGHIFEQSIADIEEIKRAIAGEPNDKKKGKRKKEGIYYTPEYITRYIVEQAVGGWLNEKREGLSFNSLPELTEKDYDSIKSFKTKAGIRYNKNIKKHLDFFEAYKKVLSNIKILDPACGSGAFLNQAFDYLYKEGQDVNRQIAELKKGQMDIFGLDKHILKNNLFGVDLNPESVEITKLGLWLKTADNKSELTALDDNIRCGNSLIDDSEIAGDRAFNWEEKFSKIMKSGGFDVVIGNPPYGADLSEEIVNTLKKKYKSFEYQVNSYVVFYERGLNLLKGGG